MKRFVTSLTGSLLLFAAVLFFFRPVGNPLSVSFTLAIAVLMACWWIFEVVPLAVTALLPIVLFPALGVMDGKQVSAAYFNDVIFLFIGGFLVALAMQKWSLHKRMALHILLFTGISKGRILLGFMLATAFLSMWISNTATAMMMIPIVMSIIGQIESSYGETRAHRFSTGLLLGVAYSASIGGTATLVGSPPNLALMKIYDISFPNGPDISFGQWMLFALPVAVALLIILWIYLYLSFCRTPGHQPMDVDQGIIRQELQRLGRIAFEERVVLIAFSLFSLLLVFRADLNLGSYTVPGWSALFAFPDYLNDGTIAITVGILLFLIPARRKKDFILDWETARSLPWRIVILFGGGFALADGFVESGLSAWIGSSMQGLIHFGPLVFMVGITAVMIFLTEVTSNTATTQMILPVVAALAVSSGTHPLLFMVPVTLAGSMAFMLPVATPPNAIIFGTSRIRVAEMARAGFIMNLLGIIIISLAMWVYGRYIFQIALNEFPAWAGFY